MKRLACICLCSIIFLCLLGLPCGAAVGADIHSKNYAVLDITTGQTLAERGAGERKYPASITKILTMALVLERHGMDERFSVAKEATLLESGATHIALSEGEQVSVRDMAYATMLASANDAANALAIYDSGSIAAFAERMNQKARELQALDSHFTNPSGLHSNEHYSTAADMAKITSWAITVPGFREVFGATEYRMAPTNAKPERFFGTYHTMYVTSAYTYDGALGGKLGWTPESHHTIVTLAERGGMELIAVALDSETKWEKFEDTTALFDYCFSAFRQVKIPLDSFPSPSAVPVGAGGEARLIPIMPEFVTLDIPAGESESAVRVSVDIPQSFPAEREPALVLSLGEEPPLLSLPLDYSIVSLPKEGDSNTWRLWDTLSGAGVAVSAAAWGAGVWFSSLPGVVQALLLLAALAFTLLVAAVLHHRRVRRRRRQRLIRHFEESMR